MFFFDGLLQLEFASWQFDEDQSGRRVKFTDAHIYSFTSF
jgi:hypothetical protein